MKIIIDGREFIRGKLTGIGRFLLTLMDEAIPLKTDWDFTLILNQHCEYKGRLYSNLKIITINEKITLFTDQIQIPLLINELNPDIFFSPYYKCPLLTKTPKIITIHDLTFFALKSHSEHAKFISKLWYRMHTGSASKIITVSNSSASDINNILSTPKDKIKVIYNTISSIFEHKNEEEVNKIKSKYGINKKYLLYVGNSNPHKNLRNLMDACNELPEHTLNEHTLVLAGIGKDFTLNNNKIKCLPIYFVDESDLPALYSGAELFVFPSLYEGFGFPPLEAMACGCPVVSSNTSSLPEVLGDACIYFDPYNRSEITNVIYSVLTDTSQLKTLKDKGRRQAKLFLNNQKRALDFISIIAESA
ncbi:MAG: glycosyltransferase family 4 protein [Elusimicrobia bacterium]|nr:glycosyltransferase family 4 protein [Candidatus Liberimonas magnetica]